MQKWNIGVQEGEIRSPSDSLPARPEIGPGELVVLTGRAPIWSYARAVHELHGSPAGAVATYDPRLGGGVVVMTHSPKWWVGQVIRGNMEVENETNSQQKRVRQESEVSWTSSGE